MCGICAVKGSCAISNVLAGLRELEYRGYDSCGIGYLLGGKLESIRTIGYVNCLERKVDIAELSEIDVCIGHTRWATNGGVTEYNSHPHTSERGCFSIVHNGIIENCEYLKENYLKGVKFTSDTDTEVIVQLMEYFFDNLSKRVVGEKNKNNIINPQEIQHSESDLPFDVPIADMQDSYTILSAFEKTLALIEGSYALVMLSRVDGRLYFARCESPLIVGRSGNSYSLASDISGLVGAQEYIVLDNECYGYIDDSLHIFDINNQLIVNNFEKINRIQFGMGKGEFEHYMLSEIYEIPSALMRTKLSIEQSDCSLPSVPDNILIIGCGTSYHSGLMSARYFERVLAIKSECLLASEFVTDEYIVSGWTLAIVISQSGETADTLQAVDKLKKLGIYTIAITNVPTSSIVGKADKSLFLDAGREVGVASTKAYVCQVLMCYLLGDIWKALGYSRGSDRCDIVSSWAKDWNDIFATLDKLDVCAIDQSVSSIIENCCRASAIHIIGKGYDYVTALEGALKIKEVSYKFTDAYPSGELKHGTLALIDQSAVAIAIVTDLGYLNKVETACKEISARGGKVIVIASEDVSRYINTDIVLPNVDARLLPVISVVPLQLLAYRLAVRLGHNPDRPRNLAKSVTVL